MSDYPLLYCLYDPFLLPDDPSLVRKPPVFLKRPLARQTDAKMSESMDSGLDSGLNRMQALSSVEPFEVVKFKTNWLGLHNRPFGHTHMTSQLLLLVTLTCGSLQQ